MTSIENNRGISFRFSFKSFCVFLLIFVVEVVIALYVRDSIIRPYGGDVLVVIMIYYFVKAFVKTKTLYIVLGTLLFAYAVEIGQYFNMVEVLGLQDSTIMRIVLGSSFSWGDILAYTIGAAICYIIDRKS